MTDHPRPDGKERICRVVGCVSFAAEDADPRLRSVYTAGICAAHRSLPDADLRELLKRRAGLVAPLEPLTDRIEYGPK